MTVKREEARNARILFIIVIIFVICNIPRIVLNLEELTIIAPSYWRKYNLFNPDATEMKNEEEKQKLCYSPPFWAHILGSISKFLLTCNASVCCFVYCVICPTFRTELKTNACTLITFMLKSFRSTYN